MAAGVLQSDQRGPMCALLYVVSEKIVEAKAALERIHTQGQDEDACDVARNHLAIRA